MSKNTCIEFKNVSKKFKELLALDDISFKIPKGEIFGYIGPNGAGKTTTIKILVGLIRNFQGDAFVYGKNISNDWKNIHNLIGYHPQEAGFQEWRTVDHVFKTFGRLSGLTSVQLEQRTQEILELINLSDVRYKKIVHLSGGMFQKLRLGQALLHEPQILVLDEPLSGLDPNMRFQFKKIIKKLGKSDITILFSSHILSDVQDVADKIGILNKGKILTIGSPEELQNSFHIGNILEIIVAENTPLCKNLEDLNNIEYVENVKSNKQLIHLKSDADIDLSISSIFNVLMEQRCKLRTFNLVKPSLEEVYLKYVGGKTD
ncbi:MAG: ABC transporter ATP-binding protein [Candidatus Lokiarchaeota archaeon]|nr:ABC transporter ATP-binding protein [Candidatus Lokiarchaeota archaeon]